MEHRIFSLAAAAALVLPGCTQMIAPAPPEGTREPDGGTVALVENFENRLADELFDGAFEDLLARDPIRQTMLGRKDDYDRWTDISPEFEAETFALAEGMFERLVRSVDESRLDKGRRLSYRVFEYLHRQRQEAYRYRLYNYPVNQMNGLQSAVPSLLINLHPANTTADLRAYISRLNGVKRLFAQLIENLELRRANGIDLPRFIIPYVIDDCRNIVRGRPFTRDSFDSPLLADFRAKTARLNLISSASSRLVADAERALLESVGPAYDDLIAYLEGITPTAPNEAGVWRFPEGLDYYAHALRRSTTTSQSAQAIHDLGLAEVARIHGAMREVMDEVGFEGTLTGFFRHLRDDPSFYFDNTPDGKQAYLSKAVEHLNRMQEALPRLFRHEPRHDLIVKAVEPFREKSAGKAFYSRPAADGSRPGIFYVNLHDARQMPTYELEALVHHEGIPGHHMQISTALGLTDLPQFRRYGGFTAYTEGWGLYMEYIPSELGFYQDPYSNFGRLAMELWRACRLVVDTGIHALKWTRAEAIDYLDANTPSPNAQNVKAVDRYVVMPGQATAYKIGMMKLLELRDRARSSLGEDFDLADFHQAVLAQGALPLDVLEDEIGAWIAGP